MKDQIKFLILMVIITIAGSLTLTYAQSGSTSATGSAAAPANFPPPPPPDGLHRGPRPDPIERLTLTDDQREQIGLIKLAARDASQENDKKIHAADEQLRLLVEGGSFMAERATPLIRAKTDAMAEAELKRLASDAEIYKLLTSEQKTQLSQLREQRPPMPPGGGFAPRVKR